MSLFKVEADSLLISNDIEVNTLFPIEPLKSLPVTGINFTEGYEHLGALPSMALTEVAKVMLTVEPVVTIDGVDYVDMSTMESIIRTAASNMRYVDKVEAKAITSIHNMLIGGVGFGSLPCTVYPHVETYCYGFAVVSLLQFSALSKTDKKAYMNMLQWKVNQPQYTGEGYYVFTNFKQADEFMSCLAYMSAQALGSYMVVAHNASYEYTHFWNKLTCLRNANATQQLSILPSGSGEGIKSIDIAESLDRKAKELMAFRDTWLYQHMKLAKYGDSVGYEKEDCKFDVYVSPADFEKAAREIAKDKQTKLRDVIKEEASMGSPEPGIGRDLEATLKLWSLYNERDCAIPCFIVADQFTNHGMNVIRLAKRCPVSANDYNNMMNTDYEKRHYIFMENGKYVEVVWEDGEYVQYEPLTHTVVARLGTMWQPVVPKRDKTGKIMYKKCGEPKTTQRMSVYDKMLCNSTNGSANAGQRGKYYLCMKQLKEEAFDAAHNAAGGGLVTCNPRMTFKEIKDVDGVIRIDGVPNKHGWSHIMYVDLTSAHPSQVYKRWFPSTQPELVKAGTPLYEAMKEAILTCSASGHLANPHAKMLCVRPIRHNAKNWSGLFNITLRNVRIKTDDKGNCVPCMSTARYKSIKACCFSGDTEDTAFKINKIENTLDMMKKLGEKGAISSFDEAMAQDEFVFRSKVFKKPEVELTVTLEDFYIMKMFYDFEIVEDSLSDVWMYQMSAAHTYLRSCFNRWGQKKQVYKEMSKLAKGEKGVWLTQQWLDDHKLILEECDYAYMSAHITDAKAAEQALTRIKGVFNGIYGMNYQSNRHAVYITTDDGDRLVLAEDEEMPQGKYEAKPVRDYLQAMYIAQWTRVDIALHTKYIIEHGGLALYIATDSIVCVVDDDLYNIYSKEVDRRASERLFNAQNTGLKSQCNYNELGGMDLEKKAGITRVAITASLKIIIGYRKYDDDNNTWQERIDAHFSGVNPDLFFKDCTTFDQYFDRMTGMDIVLTPFDTNKNQKMVEASCNNSTADTPDSDYAFVGQGLVINDSSLITTQLAVALSR